MGAPQIIWIVLAAIGLGVGISSHGQRRVGTHSMAVSIIATAIQVALLFWGGFFS